MLRMRRSATRRRRARQRRWPVGIHASGSGPCSCGPCSRGARQALPGDLGNPLLIGEGEVRMDVEQRKPGHVDSFGIGVALDTELTAGGFEQVVVDDLVDARVPVSYTHLR